MNAVLAPICTPFTGAGEVDHEAMRRNIAAYRRAGFSGFVVAGSTGEAPLLDRDERLQLFETVRAAAPDSLLLAGTGAESVRETLRLTKAAAGLGYHAALIITPHYFRAQMLRPESQLAFYRAVADDSPLPVVIYNFPQMTGIDLPVEVISALAAHPNIAGMKESSADLEKIARLTAGLPADFQIVVGSSVKFHDCLKLGARGGILAVANALPADTLAIYQRYRHGDIAGSAEAQRRIVEAAGVAPRYGIQGLKYAMDLNGLAGGPARPPLLPLDNAQKTEIAALFHAMA